MNQILGGWVGFLIMKRAKLEKFDTFLSLSRQRSIQILIGLGLLYMLLVTLEIPFVFNSGLSAVSQDSLSRPPRLESEEDLDERGAPTRPNKLISANSPRPAQFGHKIVSGLGFDPNSFSGRGGWDSELYKSVRVAWEIGGKFWEEIRVGKEERKEPENRVMEQCPNSVAINGSEFLTRKKVMVLPCGMTLGSYVSVVGKPREAHAEQDPKIALLRDEEESVMVSQFIVELQGLKTVDGEDPPRVLHFNPRLRGDWSGKPVIELNTCYRMQWGTASRCEGWKSKADEETGK